MPIVTAKTHSGIITAEPTSLPVQPINSLRVTSPQYKDVVVDTRWTPISSLLRHVEGASWTVDYYSQVLDRDSQLNGHQPTTSGVGQQYSKINNLELKVTSPLSQSQDEETKTMTYKGSALVYSFLIPNEGDMFTADIGDGQTATFRITLSSKKSVFKESVYEIEYTIGTTDTAYLTDLENKVVRTFEYRRDFINYGQDPIVIQTDSKLLGGLEAVHGTLAQKYFPMFFNREYFTLTLPHQPQSVYDSFLTDFVLSVFTSGDAPILAQVRDISVDEQEVMSLDNLWSALTHRDLTRLTSGFTKTRLVSTKGFSDNPYLGSIRYTGLKHCVYPANPRAIYSDTPETQLLPTGTTIVNYPFPLILPAVTPGDILPLNTPPIYSVLCDDYYVFSEAFYLQTANQSNLEYLVSCFLKEEAIDLVKLTALARLALTWNPLEQFYYIPIVLFLIRATVRNYQG